MNLLNSTATRKITKVSFLLLLLTLQGCAGLIVGAAGGAALAIHDRRDTETILQDQKIESIAADKIYGDAKLKTKIHANITSYNKVVLITGEVLASDLRDHAIGLVQQIPNIKRIHNELVVADLTSFASRTSDTVITSKVKTKMVNTKGLDATRVKVVTENGKVYLMGLVTDKEAELAVDVARNEENVTQVVKIFEIIPEPVVASSPAPVSEKK